MKKYIINLFLIAGMLVAFAACKKEENRVIFEGGTAPVLSASSTTPLIFVKDDAEKNAVTLNWTNPDYMFNTGLSSQNVTYTVEIDTVGSNFTNPAKAEAVVSSDLSKTFTVKELNTYLNAMDLAFNMAHEVEFRVKSTLANSSAPLYSNTVKINITPYLDTKYPVPDKLFITGGATPLGWQAGNGSEAEPPSQTFTKTNAYTFELTLALKANESYLFIPVYSSWSAKYGYDGAGNANNPDGDNFKPDGGDMKAPSTSGTYKITVDFKTGRYTVEKQ